MILCCLGELHHYLGTELAELVRTCLAQPPQPGRHTLSAGLDVIRMTYDSRERASCYLETHHEHSDIQMLLAGHEFMGVSYQANLRVHTPYDAARDAAFWQHDTINLCNTWIMRPGLAAVFPPGCAHLTQMQVGAPSAVDKVVFKLHRSRWPRYA